MLDETRRTETGAQPTGRKIDLTVSPCLPVRQEATDVSAAADANAGAAWCPVMEKALAGVDETWSIERQMIWEDDWTSICAQDRADRAKNPRGGPAPEGYPRLNQGSDSWDRAELLTQLTGQESVVRVFPSGKDEWTINRIIRDQLLDNKPVLVSSRDTDPGEQRLAHGLESAHVYEVTGVEHGRIVLHNPWGFKHPEPLETGEFARSFRPWYSTLA
ncbi:MAG TPA: hypothetical protein VGH27_20945 [Streptosporangiaceae bacterium]